MNAKFQFFVFTSFRAKLRGMLTNLWNMYLFLVNFIALVEPDYRVVFRSRCLHMYRVPVCKKSVYMHACISSNVTELDKTGENKFHSSQFYHFHQTGTNTMLRLFIQKVFMLQIYT